MCRFGFVEYETVDEAQSVFDKEENVELDGHTLFLDFAAKRTSMGYAGWEKDLELDESSKNSPVHMRCDTYNYQIYEHSVPSAESFFFCGA